ncbi:DUF7948 domain-containing protein [Paludibaculum fermentans]|uniref:DUF7948 domain-containing protein n=1 Tax=Paludibaculum fermentans TaxID=1473598 RepID=A0A7S7SKQ1_PALFE|nr:hypothetical protein [Paludibaculum fermentans]QOY89407.1 hypothetical protein IRI77_05475 [Paludibaculum fermentans]
MIRLLCALALLFLALPLGATVPEFEPNAGQAEKQYLFLARAGGIRAYIADRGLELSTSSGTPARLSWSAGASGQTASLGEWKISEATGNTTHYCVQDKSSLCTKGVQSYRRLLRTDLYPGIDWELYGRNGQLEYDLVVHPGAKVGDVRLRVEGPPAEVAADGRLRAGAILHWQPEAYQIIRDKRVKVTAALRAAGDTEFEFVVGDYDAGHDLVIDPVVQGIAVSGGGAEDEILGFLSDSRGSCTYRYGTTRSADWHQLPAAGGRHVFVQLETAGSGGTTIFWGGEGEESVGGVDSDLTNCRLYLVGSTSSRNAPTLTGVYEHLTPKAYAGGATDGFMLKFSWEGLVFAGYLGGPGADRLYDIRTTASTGYEGAFLFAGETDDPAWNGTTTRRIGAGGKADAIVGVLDGTQISLLAIGGAGDDRLMRIRSAGDGFWALAGETDSPDFPIRDGASDSVKAAAGKDLWVGRTRLDLGELSILQLFGGSGDERFGGLAVLERQAFYLAGTTTSRDLPAASGAYHGGDSDGFVAFLDPLTAAPQAATYIGGSARDEIAALDTRGGDLYLGGTTDSDDLALPGLAAGEGVHGGLDALFVLCDAFGTPVRGIRLGGSADDRVLGILPDVFGKVFLAGSSDSREWLDELDPFHLISGGQDGYLAAVAFPAVSLSGFSNGMPGRLYLGRDLQTPLTVQTTSEPGMDGMLLVRSSDPSRLLVSPRDDLPGTSQILLEGTDQVGYYSSGRSFVLQALADSGEVEIVVEGRTSASPKGSYLRRSIRVTLTPSALFLTPPKELTVGLNSYFDVVISSAPLLPDGSPGPAQAPRAGLTSPLALISSDPAGLQIVRDSLRQVDSTGSYRLQAVGLRDGTYTLTPSSTQFPAGPGQFLTVRVDSSPALPGILPDRSLILAREHLTSFSINGRAGDQLQFTSEDPSRLVLGRDYYTFADTLTVTPKADDSGGNLVVAALAGEGTARVRVEGTYQGRPISQSMLVYLVPIKATFNTFPGRIGSGVQLYVQAQLQPQTAVPDVIDPLIPYMTLRPGSFANVQLRSSNPSVLQVTKSPYSTLNYTVLAAATGDAVLDFGSDAPPELAELRASIQVVAPRMDFGADVLRIPAGASLNIYTQASAFVSATALQTVRLRLSADTPLTLARWGQSGTDITVDFSGGYGVQIAANTAQAGQKATLYISAPGVPEFALPIRIVEAVLVPPAGEIHVTQRDGQPATDSAYFRFGAYDEGLVVVLPVGRIFSSTPLKVLTRMDPPGICEVTEKGELSSPGEVIAPFTCAGTGVTILSLQPVSGLTAAQPQFTIRIVSRPGTPSTIPIATRVLTGNGLQAQLPWNSSGAPISGTITSNDPGRVRLSFDAKAPGSAKLTVPANSYNSLFYVQGFASQGTATLTVETTDGRKAEILVYLFPPTLAVRPRTSSSSSGNLPVLSVNQPLSTKDFSLDLLPALVDPDSGKVFWGSGLSIRGGTDPAFVRARTSDSSVVQPVPPDALVSEGDASAPLNFQVKATGDAVLTVTQPEGFVEVPESSLRVHVFERQLAFSTAPFLSAELQIPVSVVAMGGGFQSGVSATLTSLKPDQLLISSDGATAGETSITAPLGNSIYLQAMSSAAPGGTVRVRLEAPGYAATEQQVEFLPAELQLQYPESPLKLSPLVSRTLGLRYGPVDGLGRISSQFNGSIRPGVRLPVRISSSDSNIVGVSTSEMTLDSYMGVGLLPVAPGRAQIHIDAPPQITNRVANLDAEVGLFEFSSLSLGRPVRYLVTGFNLTNPRPQPTSISVSGGEGVPLRFGTAASGPGAPAASTLLVTLAGKESRTVYMEPAGPGNSVTVRLNAPDFKPASSAMYLPDPQARFDPATPLNLSLANRTAQVAIVLDEATRSSNSLPLGTSFGPLKLQLESSNPQVVRVAVPSVEFAPGDSRRNVGLELVGRGDAVVTLIMPAAFAGASSVRSDLVVSVR